METLVKIPDETEVLYSIEDFLALPTTNSRYELVKGELVEMSPLGDRHGRIIDNLYFALATFVRQHGLGRVYPPTGFKLAAKTVRSPDLAFVSASRLPTVQSSIVSVVPDFVFEVISPSDVWDKVEEKIEEYQEAGVKLIWVIPPRSQMVLVYHLENGLIPQLATSEFSGETILTGFSLPISTLFDLA